VSSPMLSVSELRELAGKATKGRWSWFNAYQNPRDPDRVNVLRCGVNSPSATVIETAEYGGDFTIRRDDAEFVSACDPQTIIGLLDRLEAAEKALAGLVGRYMIPGVKGNDLWEAARAALSPPKKGE
jgi:uncharacterized membrane-anchored protein